MAKMWRNLKRRGFRALHDPRSASYLPKFTGFLALLQNASWVPRRLIKKNINYYLLLNLVFRFQGEYRKAFQMLQQGLLLNPTSHQLHLKLAEVHRENVEIEQASSHLGLAAKLRPGSSTIRKLMFETDHQLYAEGAETLTQALELSPRLLLSQIKTLDRISPHYPDQAEEIFLLRNSLISRLTENVHHSKSQLSKAVSSAITMRRLGLALELARRCTEDLKSEVQARLDHLEKNLGAHLPMLELAWENERAAEPFALFQGEVMSLSTLDSNRHPIVELFIPPAIFDYPPNEKQTHQTIREFFFHVIHILFARTDLVIVPRMQLNWRYCLPKTLGCRVISYHTSGPFNPLHLHIQESPLAGYCSLDHAGFAGFATTALEHSQIIDFVAGVPDSVLEANQRLLHQAYVTQNISKYQQPTLTKQVSITGDYVFVVLQVSTDVVAKLGWMSGIDLLAGVVDHYRGSDTRVVVKSHPFCRSIQVADYLDQLETHGDIIRGKGSIHNLICNAQIVLTVNSGVGLESLMHGKLVIVAGACDYSYAAISVKNREALALALHSQPVPDLKRIRQMLYFYVHQFAIRADEPNKIHGRLEKWLL